MKKLILSCMLCLISQVTLADWVTGDVGEGKLSIDIYTLKKDPVTGYVSMWIKEKFYKTQFIKDKKYNSFTMLLSVDCENNRYKAEELVYYYNDKLIKMPLQDIQVNYKNAIPDTKGWLLSQNVCYAWDKTHENN